MQQQGRTHTCLAFGRALLRPRLLSGVAYGCSRSRSGDIVVAACGRRPVLGRRKHPIAERLTIRARISEISLAALLRVTST